MIARWNVFFSIMFLMAGLVFGEKKAKVVTETGKKWDVVFLRMSNDTVYLKARKPNGGMFSISGHKSKFKRIDFLDGTTLDLTLSNFPRAESQIKPYDIGDYGNEGDSLLKNRASSGRAWSDAEMSANKSERTDSTSIASASWTAKPDSMVNPVDSSRDYGLRSAAQGQSDTAHLTPGPGKTEMAKTRLENEKSARATSFKKKKNHAWGFSVCLLSAATLAGSGVSYYFFTEDHKKSEQAYEDLASASIAGKPAAEALDVNKTKHDAANKNLQISQILLGVGAALLVGGIVLYF